MGSVLFDYLHGESPLFDEALLNDDFSNVSMGELQGAIDRYSEFVLGQTLALQDEVVLRHPLLRMLSPKGPADLRLLSQSAFYVEQFVIDDPLFRLRSSPSGASDAMHKYLGLRERELTREEVTSVVRQLHALQPMVAAGYVKLLPFSHLFRGPKQIPIYYSATGFDDVLPADLLEWFRKRARVWPLEMANGQMAVIKTPENVPLEPRRGIFVAFDDDDIEFGQIRQLFHARHFFDDEKGEVLSHLTLPVEPPNPAEFAAWVNQTINEAARSAHDRLYFEVSLAARFQASYLTRSVFAHDLLQQTYTRADSVRAHTANVVMNMDVPFLDRVDVRTLMSVRRDHGEAFQSFRTELERVLRDLQLEDDAVRRQTRLTHALHELADVQVRAIDQELRHLRRKALADSGVAMATLAATIVAPGPWTVAAGAAAFAVAGLSGAKTAVEYQQATHRNPAYFLRKVLKDSQSV